MAGIPRAEWETGDGSFSGHEKREIPRPVVLVACMDEALSYGPGVQVAGVAGSGITQLGGGNQEMFPDSKRALVERVRPKLFRSLDWAASQVGAGLEVTSHVGCGWARMQGISDRVLEKVTGQMVKAEGEKYLGHIPFADSPVDSGKPGVAAAILRSPSDHHHDAKSIVLTIGGFITQDEINELSGEFGKPFIISADWLDYFARIGGDVREARDFIKLEIDVACGICQGLSETNSLRIYEAGRLDFRVQSNNSDYFRGWEAVYSSFLGKL